MLKNTILYIIAQIDDFVKYISLPYKNTRLCHGKSGCFILYHPDVFIARRRLIAAQMRGAAHLTMDMNIVERSNFANICGLLALYIICDFAFHDRNLDYSLQKSSTLTRTCR